MPDIRTIVFGNLNSAKENGYFEPGEHLHDANAYDIAADMQWCAEDCEGLTVEQMTPFVREWLEKS